MASAPKGIARQDWSVMADFKEILRLCERASKQREIIAICKSSLPAVRESLQAARLRGVSFADIAGLGDSLSAVCPLPQVDSMRHAVRAVSRNGGSCMPAALLCRHIARVQASSCLQVPNFLMVIRNPQALPVVR